MLTPHQTFKRVEALSLHPEQLMFITEHGTRDMVLDQVELEIELSGFMTHLTIEPGEAPARGVSADITACSAQAWVYTEQQDEEYSGQAELIVSGRFILYSGSSDSLNVTFGKSLELHGTLNDASFQLLCLQLCMSRQSTARMKISLETFTWGSLVNRPHAIMDEIGKTVPAVPVLLVVSGPA